jgi:hypothetical protein
MNESTIWAHLFTPFHFLIYNMFDFVGKSFPIIIPNSSLITSRTILFLAVIRVCFIPLFLTCNVKLYNNGQVIPRSYYFPLLFDDLGFFILVALHGFTSGVINALGFLGGATALRDSESNNNVGGFGIVGDLMGRFKNDYRYCFGFWINNWELILVCIAMANV